MKNLGYAIAGVVALASAPAFAADLRMPVKAPVVAMLAPFNWSGCYIGVSGGYASGRSTHIDPVGNSIAGTFDVDGGLIGPTVGCNFQTGAFVFGVEGDWSWSGKEGGTFNNAPLFNPLFFSETREKWIATARGRLGFAWDRMLIFATGGVAFADIEARSTGTGASVLFGQASESQTRIGWTVGAGVEWAFNQNWSIKGEYLYVEFENTAYFSPPPVGFADRSGGVDLYNHILRAGVNYRF